jgi:hypothetical protein
MALTRSHKPTREWPLLILALAVVCAICIPLWQWSAGRDNGGDEWSRWTPDRIARLLLGPEQIACYCGFVWAGFILLGRWREVRRQRKAFTLDLLPTEEGMRIMPDDARLHIRRVEQLTRDGPYILANMIRLALGKYAVTRSSQAVSDTVRTQAEVDLGRMVTSMSTVHYLAWAIPALGFLGTVRGLSGGLGMAGKVGDGTTLQTFIEQATRHLTVAFDCTLVALVLSITLMFLLHSVQRDEEALVIDCQQYCLDNLALRLYEPEPVQEI